MAQPTQQIMGLASGWDTQSIVDQLMQIERQSVTKLEEKKAKYDLQLEAYRAVNNLFLAFKTSVNTLSSLETWSKKKGVSTNEAILGVTTGTAALSGSHTFRVAQLASSAQYMSKGFSSQDSVVSPNQTGTIRIDSAKSRVDNTAKIDTLNNGNGVYRGSIRITDGEGFNTVVDLAACMTVNDVVKAINASGASVNARINDKGDGLVIENADGAGNLRIQNYGGGTTADDLGIAGNSSSGAIQGKVIYQMSGETRLNTLNDGLGIEGGVFRIAVKDQATGETTNIDVDASNCNTVQDLMNSVNGAIERKQAEITEWNRTHGADEQLKTDLAGMMMHIDPAGNDRLVMSGLNTNYSYTTEVGRKGDEDFYSASEILKQLGLEMNGLTGATMLRGEKIFGQMDSPMLKNVAGVKGDGIGGRADASVGITTDIDPARTTLAELNGGLGLDSAKTPSAAFMTVTYLDRTGKEVAFDIGTTTTGDARSQRLNGILSNPNDHTAQELADALNQWFVDEGADLRFNVDNQGFFLTDASGSSQIEADVFMTGTLARDLLNLGDATSLDLRSSAVADYRELEYTDPDTPGGTTLADLKAAGAGGALLSFDADGNLSDALTLNINGADITVGGLDAFTGAEDVDALLAHINSEIAAGFAAQGIGGAPVSLSINPGNGRIVIDGLDNADLSAMSIGGALAEKLGVALEGYDAAKVSNTLPGSKDMRPEIVGAYDKPPFDMAKDAMSSLTGADGAAFDFAADFGAGQTLDFTLTLRDGSAKTINLDLSDLDPAALASMTGDKFVNKVNEKLADAIADLDLGKEYENLKLSVQGGTNSNGQFQFSLAGEGRDGVAIEVSGALAAKLGLDANIAADADMKNAVYGDGAVNLYPRGTVRDPIRGLGTFDLRYIGLDGTGKTLSLSTAGLSGDNTLNDLVRHFNNALDTAAADLKTIGEANFQNGGVPLTYDDLNDIGKEIYNRITANLFGVADFGAVNGTAEGDAIAAQLTELAGQAYGGSFDLSEISFRVNDAGNGLAMENSSGRALGVINHEAHDLAADLGFAGQTIANNSYVNGGNYDRRYAGRATLLSELNGGAGVPAGKIRMLMPSGGTTEIDLAPAKTLGDVIDLINSYGGGNVEARINDTGDGIIVEQAGRDGLDADGNGTPYSGNIRFEEMSGGTSAAALGLLGEGTGGADGMSVLNARFEKVVEVGRGDTLRDLMFRLDDSGAPVTTSIINDGDSTNPWRLVLTADRSGAAGDFVLDTDLAIFGLRKSAEGQDSMLLYGPPGSLGGPTALTSATNQNNTSVLGLTFDLKQASAEYVTVTVSDDKEALIDEIGAMAQAFNDVKGLVNYLDNYQDEETGEPSILFGDTNIRRLMDQMSDIFFGMYKPNADSNTAQSWYDLGVEFAADGTLEVDMDVLGDMINNNFEAVKKFMASTRNPSSTAQGAGAFFSGASAEGYDVANAIDGNSLGSSKGFKAAGKIADGADEYTVMFSGASYVTTVSLFHPNSAEEPAAQFALSDFVVEYMDQNGKWQTLREVRGNKQSASYLTFEAPTLAQGLRVRASGTNAADGQFRLLDIQADVSEGLMGQADRVVNELGDSISGFWATWQEEVNGHIADVDADIEAQNERLDAVETRLYRQFTAMEKALSQLQSQEDYFGTMIDAMNNNRKKK